MQTQKIENAKLELVDRFVRDTNMNIFLTGKAGTGKTTFLRNLAKNTYKRLVILAPTGVAAINAGGQTIHSFFQLEFGPQIPDKNVLQYQKFSSVKLKIIRSLDLLVIDEISMVRADLLDSVDNVLRRVRRNEKPFGGLQVLMIGDIHQLAPVAKEEEWALLRDYYKSVYFFDSQVLSKAPYCCIELEHIYRQEDRTFIDILNKVRNNRLDAESLRILNSHYHPDFNPDDAEGYITLMTHNRQVDDINESKLNALKTKSLTFDAVVTGNFPEMSYPTKAELELKVGAQVMFVKNDPSPEKMYFNGRIGRIVAYDEDEGLQVQCGYDVISVTPVTWKNFEYSINEETKEIEEKEVGSFTQIPLKLAWAITIHKSQGLTFDKVILDASLAFAHGQVYVALSRCTSLEGLVLKARLSQSGLFNDLTINQFVQALPQREPTEEQYDYNKKKYESDCLFELFDFIDIEGDLNKIVKVIYTNKGSFDNLVKEKVPPLGQSFHQDVVEIAEKFKRQLGGILRDNFQIDNNLQLQQRVNKGCAYFIDRLAPLQEILELKFETGNKAVNDQMKKAMDPFKEDLFVKKACLEACLGGFEIKKYLAVKNKKTVEAQDVSKKKTKKERKERKKREPKDENGLSATMQRTKALIEEGMSMEEIADHRGMTLSTIEHHVAELVLRGLVNAKDLMDEEHYATIREYFEETQDPSLGAARDVLGEEYSWGELRIVLNELKQQT